MQQIKIEPNANGSHDNQTVHGTLLDGYAVIPKILNDTPTTDTINGFERVILQNYPFGEITVAEIDGYQTITSWNPLPIPESETDNLTVNEVSFSEKVHNIIDKI